MGFPVAIGLCILSALLFNLKIWLLRRINPVSVDQLISKKLLPEERDKLLLVIDTLFNTRPTLYEKREYNSFRAAGDSVWDAKNSVILFIGSTILYKIIGLKGLSPSTPFYIEIANTKEKKDYNRNTRDYSLQRNLFEKEEELSSFFKLVEASHPLNPRTQKRKKFNASKAARLKAIEYVIWSWKRLYYYLLL